MNITRAIPVGACFLAKTACAAKLACDFLSQTETEHDLISNPHLVTSVNPSGSYKTSTNRHDDKNRNHERGTVSDLGDRDTC